MPAQTRVQKLEVRIRRLERAAGLRAPESERARARRLVLDELRLGRPIDTVEFSIQHELRLDYVHDYLRELNRKGAAELVEQ